jgi:hypothetical protein
LGVMNPTNLTAHSQGSESKKEKRSKVVSQAYERKFVRLPGLRKRLHEISASGKVKPAFGSKRDCVEGAIPLGYLLGPTISCLTYKSKFFLRNLLKLPSSNLCNMRKTPFSANTEQTLTVRTTV